MTRKRFWGLRNALDVRLTEWAKANGMKTSGGNSTKKMRPVSGKPLVNFDNAKEYGWASYKECWECDGMKKLRETLGM